MNVLYRPGRKSDAPDLAVLVNYAGEGMPLAIWTSMAEPGQDPWDVGRIRAERDEGSFSWRNATVAEVDGVVAGMVVTYMTPSQPVEITEDIPKMFVPMVEMENLAPETLYINILAVKPEFRRMGIASKLMLDAEMDKPERGMSVGVADKNTGAQAFYASLGYTEAGRKPVVAEMGWETEHEEWVLLLKP